MAEKIENNMINLQEIFADIKRKKYFITRIIVVFLVFGIVIALFMQKEYIAKSVVYPQNSGGIQVGGSLSGLAALAGVNINSVNQKSSPALPADLYKNVFNNVNFKKELLQTNITLSKFPENITIYKYITSPEYKRFLWYYRLKARTVGYFAQKKRKKRLAERRQMMERAADTTMVKTPTYIPLSEIEYGACNRLNDMVQIVVDQKNNTVSIVSTMPEAVASAQVASATETLLHKYIVKYKTQKTQDYLDFVQERFNEVEADYRDKRDKLAQFQDANKSLNTAVAQARLARLEEESLAAFDVYASLTQQLEQAKISVKEDTPIFAILEPVVVPTEPIGASKMQVVLIFLFLGALIPMCFIAFKKVLLEYIPNEKLAIWFEKEEKSLWSKIKSRKKKVA